MTRERGREGEGKRAGERARGCRRAVRGLVLHTRLTGAGPKKGTGAAGAGAGGGRAGSEERARRRGAGARVAACPPPRRPAPPPRPPARKTGETHGRRTVSPVFRPAAGRGARRGGGGASSQAGRLGRLSLHPSLRGLSLYCGHKIRAGGRHGKAERPRARAPKTGARAARPTERHSPAPSSSPANSRSSDARTSSRSTPAGPV